MTPSLKSLVDAAIEELSDVHSNAGCNDYSMPDTPENRALWDEAQAWNVKVPVEQVKDHPDYWSPTGRDGKITVGDSITVYALRKATGTL